jgi:hypothetical protein
MEVSFDLDLAFTGGKDGSIFKNHLIDSNYSKIYQGDAKMMITCMKYDDINNRLWYGTPDSSFQCLDLSK